MIIHLPNAIRLFGEFLLGAAYLFIASRIIASRGHLALVSLRGERTDGRIIGIERGRRGAYHPRLSFIAGDGIVYEYRERFVIHVKKGETRPVRYSKSRPDIATCYPPLKVLIQILGFSILFGAGGAAVLGGVIYAFVTRNNATADDIVIPSLLIVIATILIFASMQSYKKALQWGKRMSAIGKVRRLESVPGNRAYPAPHVAYTTRDGREIEYWDRQLSGYSPGEEVVVYYDPEYPEFTSTATRRGSYAGQATIFGVAGIAILVLCVWFMLLTAA